MDALKSLGAQCQDASRGIRGWRWFDRARSWCSVALLLGCACVNDSEPVALSFDLVARDAGATRIVSQDLEAPAYRVIQESVAWETFRRKELTQTTNMAIDFEREIVLCVYLGEKPTGGYGVAITAIELRGQVVDVTLEFTQPPPGAMLLQVITSPYAIYRVAMPDGVRPESGTFSLQFRSTQNGTDQPMVLHPLQ